MATPVSSYGPVPWLRFGACPKCHGTLYSSVTEGIYEVTCINCGWMPRATNPVSTVANNRDEDDRPKVVFCEVCGAAIDNQKTGRTPKYCSNFCKNKAVRIRNI